MMASELVERLKDQAECEFDAAPEDVLALISRIEALEDFVRLVRATPDPDKRTEDDIDELYLNERRLAGLRRAAKALEAK